MADSDVKRSEALPYRPKGASPPEAEPRVGWLYALGLFATWWPVFTPCACLGVSLGAPLAERLGVSLESVGWLFSVITVTCVIATSMAIVFLKRLQVHRRAPAARNAMGWNVIGLVFNSILVLLVLLFAILTTGGFARTSD